MKRSTEAERKARREQQNSKRVRRRQAVPRRAGPRAPPTPRILQSNGIRRDAQDLARGRPRTRRDPRPARPLVPGQMFRFCYRGGNAVFHRRARGAGGKGPRARGIERGRRHGPARDGRFLVGKGAGRGVGGRQWVGGSGQWHVFRRDRVRARSGVGMGGRLRIHDGRVGGGGCEMEYFGFCFSNSFI